MNHWTSRLVIVLGLCLVMLVAAACNGDDPTATPTVTATPTATPTMTAPVSGVGPGISIGEAVTSSLTGPLLINGFLHAQDGQVRLCEWLAESLPPQCGARFFVVQGLDLTTMSGLTSEGSVTWSDQVVQVLGTVEGEVLTVAGNVR